MNRNLTPIVLIILAIGIFYTFTNGRIGQLNVTQAQNAAYLAAINNSAQLIIERNSILDTYKTISPTDQQRLATLLPDNVDNVRLIIDVSGIASRHGFSLQNITTSADTTATQSSTGVSESSGASGSSSSYGAVTISFNFTSSYQNLVAFLQDIQASLRILDISQLSISAGTVPGTYTCSMQLTTYWLK